MSLPEHLWKSSPCKRQSDCRARLSDSMLGLCPCGSYLVTSSLFTGMARCPGSCSFRAAKPQSHDLGRGCCRSSQITSLLYESFFPPRRYFCLSMTMSTARASIHAETRAADNYFRAKQLKRRRPPCFETLVLTPGKYCLLVRSIRCWTCATVLLVNRSLRANELFIGNRAGCFWTNAPADS